MDISPDGQYLFTCALLKVISANSVADGRVYNGDVTSDKNSLSSTFDQITSVFMRYVSISDPQDGSDAHCTEVEPLSQSPRSLDQIQLTLHETPAPSIPISQRLDDIERPFWQPSRISTHYLTAMTSGNGAGQGNSSSSSAVDPNTEIMSSSLSAADLDTTVIAFSDPKIPAAEGESRWKIEERLCLFKIDFNVNDFPHSLPEVYLVNSTPLSGLSSLLPLSPYAPHLLLSAEKLMRAVTSIKLSPTGRSVAPSLSFSLLSEPRL
jgi:hypothetical protein